MKVWYKTILSESSWQPGDYFDHREVRTEFCCKQMEEAWGEFVGFDDSGPKISLKTYRWESEDYLAIAFCPWCKAPVEAIESLRVRQIPRKVKREIEDTEYDYVELPVKQLKDEWGKEDAA